MEYKFHNLVAKKTPEMMSSHHFRSFLIFQDNSPKKLITHGVGAFLPGVFVEVTVADSLKVRVIVDVADGRGVLLGVGVDEGTSV